MRGKALVRKPLDNAIPDIDQLVNLFVRVFPRLDDSEQALALTARPAEDVRQTLNHWSGRGPVWPHQESLRLCHGRE